MKMKLLQVWQAAKNSIIRGAIAGALVATFLGVQTFGWIWGMLSVIPGGIIGAVCGVDSLIRPPGPISRRYPVRDGPFTKGAILTAFGLVCLVFGLYSWSDLVFICQRQVNGQVDCRRTAYVWLNQVKDNEQMYEQVDSATQLQSDMVLVSTASGDQSFLDGFGPDTADQIKRFIDSKEQTLMIEDHDDLWFFSPLFLGIALVLWVSASVNFRSGIKKLNEHLKIKRN